MELQRNIPCINNEDPPGAFVRDWRIRKVSPVRSNKSLNTEGSTTIVRRRTVITIGSESRNQSIRQEDQPVSASEVGETACGRISITVTTLPKSDPRLIGNDLFDFDSDVDSTANNKPEAEWSTTRTLTKTTKKDCNSDSSIPQKPSLFKDPSWISVSSVGGHDRSLSKVRQLQAWTDDRPSGNVSNGNSPQATYSVVETLTNDSTKQQLLQQQQQQQVTAPNKDCAGGSTTCCNICHRNDDMRTDCSPTYSVKSEAGIIQQQYRKKEEAPEVIRDSFPPSSRLSLKPTFKMILGNESRILQLRDSRNSDSVKEHQPLGNVGLKLIHPPDSISRTPVRYMEWFKSLDESESTDKLKTEFDNFSDYSANCYSSGKSVRNNNSNYNNNTRRDIIQVKPIDPASTPRSILRNISQRYDPCSVGSNKQPDGSVFESENPATSIKNNSQTHSEESGFSSLTTTPSTPVNTKKETVIDHQGFQDSNDTDQLKSLTDDRSSSTNLVNWLVRANSAIETLTPKTRPLTPSPHLMSLTNSHHPSIIKKEKVEDLNVVNQNQINSMLRSTMNKSVSDCWKKNSSIQDGDNSRPNNNNSTLSSGMAIDKATELVRQFFNAGPQSRENSNHCITRSPSIVDKKATIMTPSTIELKPINNNASLTTEDHQTIPSTQTITQSSVSDQSRDSSPQNQQQQQSQSPIQEQQKQPQQQQQRGRSTIKSKIPLRVQRPTSVSVACSHSNGNSPTMTANDRSGNVVGNANNNCNRNLFVAQKSKTTACRSAIKAHSHHQHGRTRSVETSRQNLSYTLVP